MEWQPDYYGDEGCCLTCDEETKEINATEDEYGEPDGKCLCRNCLCRQCFWYEPDYGDFDVSDGGSCTYPRKKYIPKNRKSIYEVGRISRETGKAVLVEIKGLNGLHWIPTSCIFSDGKIKQWFINKLLVKPNQS